MGAECRQLELSTDSTSMLGLTALPRWEGTQQEFRKGQFVFYQGHSPIGIWLHWSGRVAFLRDGELVSECCQPCVLGLEAVSEGSVLPYAARAEEDVWITFVSRSALLQGVRREVFDSGKETYHG